jgi:hypothetical protein
MLGSRSSAEAQESAARALGHLSSNVDNKGAIATSGAIPALVQLLGAASPAGVHLNASGALMLLARNSDAHIARAIAAAGAISPLVRLLATSAVPVHVQEAAAGALVYLSCSDAEIRSSIVVAAASAGVLPMFNAVFDSVGVDWAG